MRLIMNDDEQPKPYWVVPKDAKLLDFAPYWVTKDGKTVFSMITGKPLKQTRQKLTWVDCNGNKKHKSGYFKVWLKHKDGTSHWHSVHRLVAKLFVVNYKPSVYKEVGHKDNDKQNNHYTNLYWTDHKGNIRDAIKSGLNVFGRNDLQSGRVHWRKGKKHSAEVKKLMSAAKLGEKHPKFKGWYLYDGKKYSSLQQLADVMGTYPMKIRRMLKKGLIKFEAK